jgi:hypothetical protein
MTSPLPKPFREPFEHDASTPDRFDRRRYDPHLYEGQTANPEWLRVFRDAEFGFVCIASEEATSEKACACSIVDTGDEVVLTVEQARWLHATLGALLLRLSQPSNPETDR